MDTLATLQCIGPDSPALAAMDDFLAGSPITVHPDLPVADAREIMQRMGVNALIVTSDDDDVSCPAVLGVVTLARLGRPGRRHVARAAPLRVRDVMTGRDELPVVHAQSLRSLTVRELHERFQGTGLTHLLIVDSPCPDTLVTRGLVSRTVVGGLVGHGHEGRA